MDTTINHNDVRKKINLHGSLLGFALIVVILSRLLLYTISYLGFNLFPLYIEQPVYHTVNEMGQTFDKMQLPEKVSETWLPRTDDFLKFDAYSYIRIASDGYDQYQMNEPHPPANWVFFPLYPLMVKSLSYVLPWFDIHTVGMLLSNLLLVLALYYLQLIAMHMGQRKEQVRNLIFIVIIYPSSIYFSLMYTESLFLLLSAATIYYALTRRHLLAFIAAGLATVTRVPGIANLFLAGSMMLYDMFAARGLRLRWTDLRFVLYAIVASIPLLLYFSYMKYLTGSFLAPIQEMNNWGRSEGFPFLNIINYLRDPYFIGPGGWDNGVISLLVGGLVLLVFLIYGILHFRTLISQPRQLLLFVYGMILVAIPFSSSPTALTSIIRYLMVSIPFYFYLQQLMDRHILVKQFVIYGLLAIHVIISISFINNYFFIV